MYVSSVRRKLTPRRLGQVLPRSFPPLTTAQEFREECSSRHQRPIADDEAIVARLEGREDILRLVVDLPKHGDLEIVGPGRTAPKRKKRVRPRNIEPLGAVQVEGARHP